jgi:hypothetical protein
MQWITWLDRLTLPRNFNQCTRRKDKAKIAGRFFFLTLRLFATSIVVSMPFTFSHPAAVLPFGYLPKRFFSMTGLAIGSTAPDFEYFLRMRDRSIYGHTWAGIFYFDLPVSILLAFLFHLVVRNNLIDNLPGFLARRLQSLKEFDWSTYFKENIPVVIISICIGAASHIIWDKFTHGNSTSSADMFPVLLKKVNIKGQVLAVYDILQIISSMVGGLAVLYALWQYPPQNTYIARRSFFLYWITASIMACPLIIVRLLTRDYNRNFDDLVMLAIAGGLFGIVLASLIFRKKEAIEFA